MNSLPSIQLAEWLRRMPETEMRERMADLSLTDLVGLLAVRWKFVANNAWGMLRGHPEKNRMHQLIMDFLEKREFSLAEAKVRALSLLVAEAARNDRAKSIYRQYLKDRSRGAAGYAIAGSVWSLDTKAIPAMREQALSARDEWLQNQFRKAIKAIDERNPKLLPDAARNPAEWGLDLTNI